MTDFGKSAKQLTQSYDNLTNKNKNVRLAILGLLVLYTILIVPLLTHGQLDFLENNIVRIVIIILISLTCLVDPVLSLILAICFVVTLNRLNGLKNKEIEIDIDVGQENVNLNLLQRNAHLNSNVNSCNCGENNCNCNKNGCNCGENNCNCNSNDGNDGLLNDTDMDINNNVVNNNNVGANNNVVVANNNNVVANNNNVGATNNPVVNNNLLNNSALVNNVNPNDLDYLNDKMNVLTNTDSSAANTVSTNNRDVRRGGDVPGYDDVGNVHTIGGNLLMNGTIGYNLKKNNNLAGKYNNRIMPNNSATISGASVPPAVNNVNRNTNNRINNFDVQGYNSNNLVNKNPFPGNNVNFQVDPQASELNVPGYNSSEYEQLTVNNNDIKENLTVEKFQNNTSNELNSLNNLIQINGVNNLEQENPLNVLNNVPQQMVHNNNKVKIENIIKNNNNVEKLPQSLLFTSPKQLQNAQDRSVYCEGSKNNEPIISANDSHSAQGYNLPGNINGYNKYGAQAINYLCVSDNC